MIMIIQLDRPLLSSRVSSTASGHYYDDDDDDVFQDSDDC